MTYETLYFIAKHIQGCCTTGDLTRLVDCIIIIGDANPFSSKTHQLIAALIFIPTLNAPMVPAAVYNELKTRERESRAMGYDREICEGP